MLLYKKIVLAWENFRIPSCPYAGNAEISDTANLLIFEACLAGFNVYVYGAVSENLFVPAMDTLRAVIFRAGSYFFAVRLTAVLRTGC